MVQKISKPNSNIQKLIKDDSEQMQEKKSSNSQNKTKNSAIMKKTNKINVKERKNTAQGFYNNTIKCEKFKDEENKIEEKNTQQIMNEKIKIAKDKERKLNGKIFKMTIYYKALNKTIDSFF